MDAEANVRPASRWGAEPTDRPGLRLPIVLAVAAMHMACIAAFGLPFRVRHAPPRPAETAIHIVFVPAAPHFPEPSIRALAPGILPVPAVTVPATLAALPPLTLPPRQAVVTARARRQVPRAQQAQMPATPGLRGLTSQALSPPSAPPSAPVSPPAPDSADMLRAMANWETRIRQAVQNAALYPAAARLLRRDGRAQVRFDYDRGKVESASIAQTSHFSALDTAALAAVTRAVIPDPPAELGPQRRTMLVWVQFKLVSEE